MKLNKGKFVSIYIKGWQTSISGFILDHSEEWILMKQNPVDYITDGFVIVKRKHIVSIQNGKEEQWTKKVLELKGLNPEYKVKIPLDDLETILNHLSEQFGVFQLYRRSAEICYLGRNPVFGRKVFQIEDMDTRGKWIGKAEFRTSDIRVIEFDTDYINSLKLVAEMNKESRKMTSKKKNL